MSESGADIIVDIFRSQGVRYVFGNPGSTEMPFIDAIYVQNMRVRVIHCCDQTVTTTDGKPLCVTGNVSFRVVDIERLYMSVHQPEHVIRRDVQAAIAGYVSTRTLGACAAGDLEAHVRTAINLSAYGLEGSGFCLTDWLTVKSLRLINQGLGEWINSEFRTDHAVSNSGPS